MGYQSTLECVLDLEKHGQLVRIREPVDPDLEMAEIQRRVYQAQGPAILFENVLGSPFPAACNLFGTIERGRFIFRDTLKRIQKVIQLKADPTLGMKAPWRFASAPLAAWTSLPRKVSTGPILFGKTKVSQLPQIKSWPDDGGPFITLPQVYTEDVLQPGAMQSNLGMYRIQMGGNDYEKDSQIGLHYQIHRGIGIHHTRAIESGKDLRVSIFVGGPPANTFAAVMPLPEGLTELIFAGMLGGQRFKYIQEAGHTLAANADFCIVGKVNPDVTLDEGPFGDHLGYYSLKHPFPVLEVEEVYHREDAIWPFTVVGRPPQEDTTFGKLIHDLTGPLIPTELPGIRAVHAVDQAGVHPLLLAIGSERYVPYQKRQPQEILTQANAILGFGQCSLAKYLIITSGEDDPNLNINNMDAFFTHVLERIDLSRDLHFQTKTTIDTLDYSGTGINQGSKVVIASAGEKKRELISSLPDSPSLPEPLVKGSFVLPGVLICELPEFKDSKHGQETMEKFIQSLEQVEIPEGLVWIIAVDQAKFTSHSLKNFLWVTFTRSNPSHDIYGVHASIENKHWGCKGPLIIDARIKPHHAPPLIEDPKVTQRVDELAKKGGPLHGII